MADAKQLRKENTVLKHKNAILAKKYNNLLAIANELNTQVKEYKALATKLVEMCNAQLAVTETYHLKKKGE